MAVLRALEWVCIMTWVLNNHQEKKTERGKENKMKQGFDKR